ncbi:MAG: hypothetical protein GXY19_08905 [Phycisphaerae bacterium]|nr:hypothetical protein [Phycisphaerae bacterium]
MERNSGLGIAVVVWSLVVAFGLSARAQYGGGTGEPNDPYLIYTPEQLNAIGADPNDWSKHFKLMADLDLSAYTGTQYNIIGTEDTPFSGTFDGNSRVISGFALCSADRDDVGLFGYIRAPSATIRDLTLAAPWVDGGEGNNVGAVVGCLQQGAIARCYVDGGSVCGGNRVGGMTGMGQSGALTDCHSTADVEGNYHIGGLVGYSLTAIKDCHATGHVTGGNCTGGLVGTSSGSISRCFAAGQVTGQTTTGGLVGRNGAYTIDCYALGAVIGNDRVGGLVGYHGNATLLHCYAAGPVTGKSDVGGLAGYTRGGTAIASFWDMQTTGQEASSCGTGRTTAQMQTGATFFGWATCDSEGTWTLDEGHDYPRLQWEQKGGIALTPLRLPDHLAGSGTRDAPYEVYTAGELNLIGVSPCEWDKHFKLMADINLSALGHDFNIIGRGGAFTGVFDGDYHSISNLVYASTQAGQAGLFARVSDPNAEIRNLSLIDCHIDATPSEGVGLLVGHLISGRVTQCHSSGTVMGGDSVGGLVGWNSRGIVAQCYSSATVSGGEYCTGGLIGFCDDATVVDCYTAGDVTGEYYVGGLLGRIDGGAVTNCYAMSSVSGYSYIGGLVGIVDAGIVSCCYANGPVSSDYIAGGLIGWGNRHAAILSVWDIESSGQATSASGKGCTTAEMCDSTTYLGWSAIAGTEAWTIDEGHDYPRLSWERQAGRSLPTTPLSELLNGTGQETDPFLIETTDDLSIVGLFPLEWDKHFMLTANLDLCTGAELGSNIIGINGYYPFSGVFDGSGHAISGYDGSRPNWGCAGFFGYVVGANACVKNLNLIDPRVEAVSSVCTGTLVGYLSYGSIRRCSVRGGSVIGTECIGGLVGSVAYGTVSECFASSTVRDEDISGGVFQEYRMGPTDFARARIAQHRYAGGLAGENWYGTIANCYALGPVAGDSTSGGLLGQHYEGTITKCFSAGPVVQSGTFGGLMGSGSASDIQACFWDMDGSGVTTSKGGTGLTTAQMQTAATFLEAGWDFVGETANGTEDLWWIIEGQDYPRLWFEADGAGVAEGQ